MIVELAKVTRSTKVESIHYGHACVQSKSEPIIAWGDENFSCFTRSLIKPIQAKIAVDILSNDISDEDIAIGCSSHAATEESIACVKELLKKFANQEEDLICGLFNGSGKMLKSKLHHNCSGKHALLLAACRKKSYPIENYNDPNHPLQQMILKELTRLSGDKQISIAVDGCGLPTFYLSLQNISKIFLNLLEESQYQRIIAAMNKFPDLIGGVRNFDSLLMKQFPNQFLAKAGAEGLMVIVNLAAKKSLVIKIIDGSTRAKSFIANHFSEELKWIPKNSLAVEKLIYNSNQLAVGEFISKIQA